MKQLVILGSGGHAKEILSALDDINAREPAFDFLGFVDPGSPDRKGRYVCDHPVIGGYEVAPELSSGIHFCCGIGDPFARMKECLAAESLGWKPATLIHPVTSIAASSRIGDGTFIGLGSIVGADAVVGVHCSINVHVAVGHDSSVGDYSVLSPGAKLLGGTEIGDLVLIGANAVVHVGRRVGRAAVLGAASFLVEDLAPDRSALGNPARPFPSSLAVSKRAKI
jgi:sugar O-acyltransferase (sialic acid O-acetyltransferase NeuD family)